MVYVYEYEYNVCNILCYLVIIYGVFCCIPPPTKEGIPEILVGIPSLVPSSLLRSRIAGAVHWLIQ